MKADHQAVERLEQSFVKRVASAWAQDLPARSILEEASEQGVNVARVKRQARETATLVDPADEAPPKAPPTATLPKRSRQAQTRKPASSQEPDAAA